MRTGPTRAERSLHPGAWWLWALGLAAASTRTSDPLLLLLVVVVAALVVVARRSDAPWALDLRAYLVLGAVVVVVRVLFRVLFGAGGTSGGEVLVDLPSVPLPDVLGDLHLLGPLTAAGLLAGLRDGLGLAAVLVCVGAASCLADPRRMLRTVPGALAEVATAVVVALTVAPQLVESAQRVRRARRLRGGPSHGLRALRGVVSPVLQDALDRSLALAAAMDVRGFGRTAGVPRRVRTVTGALLVLGLIGVCLGLYGLLDPTAPPALGTPVVVGGVVLALLGLRLAGRRVHRTVHRPDPWGAPEWAVTATGVVVVVLLALAAGLDPVALDPPAGPPAWPDPGLLPVLALLLAAAPAVLAPVPPPTTAGPGPAGVTA